MNLPKLVVDDVIPYSFRTEKGLCSTCNRPFANHEPEDLFLVGEHVRQVREYFAALDARQGENRGIAPSFSEEQAESVLTEREIVKMIQELWLQKGPDYANQFQHMLAYATREYGAKWEWGFLTIAIEQYRIHFDNTVSKFQMHLQEIARVYNIGLDTPVGKEEALKRFHEEIGTIAKNQYDDFAAQLHALESRVARNEKMRMPALQANPERKEYMEFYKEKKREAAQPRVKPMEKEIQKQT